MSTSVIAEGRTEQKAWQDEGHERQGKSQDRGKGIDRVGLRRNIRYGGDHDVMQGLGYGGGKGKYRISPRA